MILLRMLRGMVWEVRVVLFCDALESSTYHHLTVGHLPLQPSQNALRAEVLADSFSGLPNRGFHYDIDKGARARSLGMISAQACLERKDQIDNFHFMKSSLKRPV